MIHVLVPFIPQFHLSFPSAYPPPNPHTSSLCGSYFPSFHNTPTASSLPCFNLTPHFPRSIHSSIAPCLQWKGVRFRKGKEGREKRAVWNPLASLGISVSLWEPYWLPSFIIIPPPLPPSGSCTNHAFSFSCFLLPFIPPVSSFPFLSFLFFFFFCYFLPSVCVC